MATQAAVELYPAVRWSESPRTIVTTVADSLAFPLYGLVAQDLDGNCGRYIAVISHFCHPDSRYVEAPLFGVASTPHAAIDDAMSVLTAELDHTIAVPSRLEHMIRQSVAQPGQQLYQQNSDRAKSESLYYWLNQAAANLLPGRTHDIFHIDTQVLKHTDVRGLNYDLQVSFYGMGMIKEKQGGLEVTFWDRGMRHALDALKPELPLFCVVQPEKGGRYAAYMPQVRLQAENDQELQCKNAPTPDSALRSVLALLQQELRDDLGRPDEEKVTLAVDMPLPAMLKIPTRAVAKLLSERSASMYRTGTVQRLHTPDLAADVVVHMYHSL